MPTKKENINELMSMLYCCSDSEISEIVKAMRTMPHVSRIALVKEIIRKGSDHD